MIRRNFTKLVAGLSLAASMMGTTAIAEDMRIAVVVKALGIGFFEAAAKGAEEAAGELGGVDIIYTGPTDTTAEGQIEVINSLIAQGVDAIAISADPDALVPSLKKAMSRGSCGFLGPRRCSRRSSNAFEPFFNSLIGNNHQAGCRSHAKRR